MKLIRKYTEVELLTMPKNQYNMLSLCLEIGTLRLLGLFGYEAFRVEKDPISRDILIYGRRRKDNNMNIKLRKNPWEKFRKKLKLLHISNIKKMISNIIRRMNNGNS